MSSSSKPVFINLLLNSYTTLFEVRFCLITSIIAASTLLAITLLIAVVAKPFHLTITVLYMYGHLALSLHSLYQVRDLVCNWIFQRVVQYRKGTDIILT